MSYAREYKLRQPGDPAPAKAVPMPAPAPVPAKAPAPAAALVPQPGGAGLAQVSRAFCGGLTGGPPASGGLSETILAVACALEGGDVTAPEGPPQAGGPESGFRYPSTADQLLGPKERTRLAILAKQAWEACGSKGNVNDWRHEHCAIATLDHPAGQIGGITEATRAHYKDLEAHFAHMAGQTPRDFQAALQTGFDAFGFLRADSAQARFALKEAEKEAQAAGLHVNYIKKIIEKRFHGALVLNRNEAWQLVFTLKNRGNAKTGKGNPANRNKSQRRHSRRTGGESPELDPENIPF